MANLMNLLPGLSGRPNLKGLESKLKDSEVKIQQLERSVRTKDREIAELKHQLANEHARLQELIGADQLTALPNRHAFKEHLTHSLKRAVRLGYCLSIMLVDIDRLSELNHKHGFDKGDEILIEVAKVLKASVREVDMPCRWGGQQLAAVLHETDTEGAYCVAERVRKRVAMLDITDSITGKVIPVSTTLAVASYPRHSADPKSLMESAAESLQQARERGESCVIIASK
jgi:diguanylate cyclase (GGDEF)-like protein